LRPATYGQNAANKRMPRKSNLSGVPGVCKSKNGWIVRFRRDGKDHYFGFYRELDAAIEVARNSATLVHGEFSPYGPKDDGMAAVHAAARQVVAHARASGSASTVQWISDQIGATLVLPRGAIERADIEGEVA
jgi:hypothetical protein